VAEMGVAAVPIVEMNLLKPGYKSNMVDAGNKDST
jgi:hypothetical protein